MSGHGQTDAPPAGGTPGGGAGGGAPPMIDQTAHCRIKRNDGSGGVVIDRVSKQALAWHFHAVRWTPWVSTGRDEAGDWEPGNLKVEDATAVWYGHRGADPDKWCKGFVSQVFYLPVKAHRYGSDPDGNSIHRWEIGIDRAHHHHSDVAHGPLHHIGIFPWPRGSGVLRPVFMHHWAKRIGGDDKWHWFAVTPGRARPTPPPRRPTPHPGRPTPPPSRPTTPSTPSGGPTTPSTPSSPVPGTTPNPYAPGGTLPPGTPTGPTNPYAPGGKYGPGTGTGGGGVPPDTPGGGGGGGGGGGAGGGGGPVGGPRPSGPLGPFEPGAFGNPNNPPTPPDPPPVSVFPGPGPQFEMAEMMGEQSVYEGGVSIDNQIVNTRSVSPSRFGLGTQPLKNTAFLPERVSRWNIGTQPPEDRGALAKAQPLGSVAWTAKGLTTDTWQESEVGSLDENDERVAMMDRMNVLARRLEALNRQNRLPIRGARLAFGSVSTVTVGTAGETSAMVDSTQGFLIEFDGALTADITVSGKGGLDAGAESADTWFAVHVIADTGRILGSSRLREPNTPALLLSTSATAPKLPAGYDVFRRVGWVRNDAASDLQRFTQEGDGPVRRYEWDVARSTVQALIAGSAVVFTSVSLAAFIPPDVQTAILALGVNPDTAIDDVALRPVGSGVTPLTAIVRLRPGVTVQADAPPFEMFVGTTSAVEYAVSSPLTTADIYVAGFVEKV